MKQTLLFSMLLAGTALLTEPVFAQQYRWATSQGINFQDNPEYLKYSVAADANGNVVHAGLKQLTSSLNWDAYGSLFLDQYDRHGNLLWQKQLSGSAQVNQLAISPAGDIYLLGSLIDSLTLDATHVLHEGDSLGPGNPEQFLASFDANGNFRWSMNPNVSFTMWTMDVRGLAFDAQSNLYLGHDIYQSSYVTKLDPQGNQLFTITQQAVSRITSVAVDGAGNIFTSGSCGNPMSEFNGQVFSTPAGYATYVAKYNPAGQAQWVKWVDDITCGSPQIKADAQGNLYYAHSLFGPTAFGSFQLAGPGQGQVFAFLAKLDGNGNYQWVKQLPAAAVSWNGMILPGKLNFLDLDAAGNAYVAGMAEGTVDWGNGHQTTQNGQDFFVQKINPQGQLEWVSTGGGNANDEAQALAVTPAGEVYIAGTASQAVTLGNTTLQQTGTAYPFLASLNSTALAAGKPLVEELELLPNPASELLELHLPSQKEQITIEILNSIGQTVQRTQRANTGAVLQLDISHLPAGSYLVRAQAGQRHFQRLIVKQ